MVREISGDADIGRASACPQDGIIKFGRDNRIEMYINNNYIDDRAYLSAPDNDPRKAFRCDNCGELVYVGEWYYELSGDTKLCEYCLPKTLEGCGRQITSDDIDYEYLQAEESDDVFIPCSDDF